MTSTREVHLVKVELNANSNKFYRMTLDTAGTLTKNWGRVGATGQVKIEHGNNHEFDRALREKMRRGYTEVDVLSASVSSANASAAQVKAAAQAGLVSARSTALDELIDRLVAVNKHQILETSGGLISVNTSGQVTSPLGVLSQRSVADARNVLNDIRLCAPDSSGYPKLLETYLRLVPQKVPSKAGWAATFFTGTRTFAAQADFLDQLEATLGFAAARTEASVDATSYANLFRLTVSELDDDAEFSRIAALVDKSRNTGHASARLTLKRVFVLTDTDKANAAFEAAAKRLGNVHELFHGSRAGNVLSILRKGLFVPPRDAGIQIQGRMFGDGIYFSNQSTKSLNYSQGGTWDSSARDNHCFMLLNRVVMGNEYRPRGSYSEWEARHGTSSYNSEPYNSVNVKAGTAGVRNHEAVVWDSDQIAPTYLLEFAG